ncbi:MAG: peptide ABC transporter substrate-binding protein [Actinomycetota bacterium]|nr:peptide ABC transporter substrate-binding protein [Actinomycetota bacterium]
MRNYKKLIGIIAVLTIIVFVGAMFTGCKTEATGEQIMRLHIVEPVSLDPPNAYESEGIQVIRQCWDGLIDWDPETYEPIPELAESWDISDDGLVYTFNLRKGVKFHSGRELVAEDFVYSWSRVANAETASYLAYHLLPILGYDECQAGTATVLEGVKALDDYTLEVTLKEPYADFLTTLGHDVFYPVAKEDIEEWGDEYTEHINGVGPFKFVKWEHDQYIDLVRNEDYWGEKAKLESVRYVIIADEDTAFLEFKAGNLEYTEIPVGKIQTTLEDPELKDNAIIKPFWGLYYYGFNLNAEPFADNKALREAISYAIDRQNICDVISEGVPTPATGFVPPGIPGFKENASDYVYNVELAKQKLADAGYPDGEGLPTLEFGFNTGAGHEQVAEAIQSDLNEIGINVNITGYEWGTMLEKAQAGEIVFYRLGWIADYPTMDNFLFPLFYSGSSDNYGQYNNPAVDALLLEARSTLDEDERIAKYREVEKLILDDAAFANIYWYGTRRITQPYVKGFFLNNMENYDLSKVWLEK